MAHALGFASVYLLMSHIGFNLRAYLRLKRGLTLLTLRSSEAQSDSLLTLEGQQTAGHKQECSWVE